MLPVCYGRLLGYVRAMLRMHARKRIPSLLPYSLHLRHFSQECVTPYIWWSFAIFLYYIRIYCTSNVEHDLGLYSPARYFTRPTITSHCCVVLHFNEKPFGLFCCRCHLLSCIFPPHCSVQFQRLRGIQSPLPKPISSRVWILNPSKASDQDHKVIAKLQSAPRHWVQTQETETFRLFPKKVDLFESPLWVSTIVIILSPDCIPVITELAIHQSNFSLGYRIPSYRDCTANPCLQFHNPETWLNCYANTSVHFQMTNHVLFTFDQLCLMQK